MAASEDSDATVGIDRRVIPQRSTRWAQRSADVLFRARLRPNQISVLSVVFSAVAAAALIASSFTSGSVRIYWLVAAVLCIPLRLLCNMLDGMLAVEKGLHSPTGDLFNELPDRVADLLVIAAAGYAAAGVVLSGSTAQLDIGVILGWLAAALAILTAYVRTLGAAQGVGNFFAGPMPKPVRMWVVVLAALASIFTPALDLAPGLFFFIAVAVIAAGSLITVIVRLRLIVAALHAMKGA